MNDEAQPVTLLDLLDRLIEPSEPPLVSMMPQTWGWVVLALILLAVCIFVAMRMWRRYRTNAYRRYALKELEAARDDPAAIAAILRRTALAAYPRSEVAGLAGDDWLRFLDARVSGKDFLEGSGRQVAAAPHRATQSEPALYAVAKDWIVRHRPEKTP
jgi:Ca-activated chloride channel family protein